MASAPDGRTFGERAADGVVAAIGSWKFLIIQGFIIAVWVAFNSWYRWPDRYPFILLNLGLSLQAAVAGPAILLSGNRQATKDREQALADYLTNVKAEQEIVEEAVHVHHLEEVEDRLQARIDRLGDELVTHLLTELRKGT